MEEVPVFDILPQVIDFVHATPCLVAGDRDVVKPAILMQAKSFVSNNEALSLEPRMAGHSRIHEFYFVYPRGSKIGNHDPDALQLDSLPLT